MFHSYVLLNFIFSSHGRNVFLTRLGTNGQCLLQTSMKILFHFWYAPSTLFFSSTEAHGHCSKSRSKSSTLKFLNFLIQWFDDSGWVCEIYKTSLNALSSDLLNIENHLICIQILLNPINITHKTQWHLSCHNSLGAFCYSVYVLG